jgi:hypothetical protein
MSRHDIVFQHPVALLKDLICKDSLEGATSYYACRLLMCYVVTLL